MRVVTAAVDGSSATETGEDGCVRWAAATVTRAVGATAAGDCKEFEPLAEGVIDITLMVFVVGAERLSAMVGESGLRWIIGAGDDCFSACQTSRPIKITIPNANSSRAFISYAIKPRSDVAKRPMFGNTVAISESLTPNQRARVAEYWSTDVVGIHRPVLVSFGPLTVNVGNPP
jgi:hypothetical protein